MADTRDRQPESRLMAALMDGRFVVTAEITPPLSAAAADLRAMAAPLRDRVDAVNVTDGPRARVHMSGLAAAAILAADGIEPILQMTCRDRNRIALQSDLLGASALGIRNILIMRGDQPDSDEIPPPKPVFDLDSKDLIHLAAGMRDDSVLASGRAIKSPPRLFIGAADTPVDPPADWRPESLLAKADAGARFVQTQLCFDIDIIRRYVTRLGDLGITDRLYILIGLGPLASARSARWMRDNLWGVIMPDHLIARLEQAHDPAAEGVAICTELIDRMRGIAGVSGAHLMAPGNSDGLSRALQALDLPKATTA